MAWDPVTRSTLSACTIATAARFPAARAVARSFLAAHPGAAFVTLLVDADPDALSEPGVLSAREVGVSQEEFDMLRTAYSADELCAVLLPRLLRWMIDTRGAALYLDPCVLVTGPVTSIVDSALRGSSLVLVPRVLASLPDDERRPAVSDLSAMGVYDDALLAVSVGAEGL